MSLINPAVTVQLQDSLGNPINIAGVFVSIVLNTPLPGVILYGTLTQATNASGLATFSGLQLDKAGSYTLAATVSGLPPVLSSSFNVTPGLPAKLSFVQHPPLTTTSMSFINPPVTVQVQDAGGNPVNVSAATQMSLTNNLTGAILNGGILQQTTPSGLAIFPDLFIDKAGSYTLTATSGGLLPAVSTSFNIIAGSAA
jgi:hypothetical protein